MTLESTTARPVEAQENDERTLWVGQPRPDLAARTARVLVPIGATFVFTGVMFAIMVAILIARWMFLLGIPVVGLGCALIAAPWLARLNAARTEYRLTDRRIVVRRPRLFQGVVEEQFNPAEIDQVEAIEQREGQGDLVLFLRDEVAGEGVTIARRAFEGIDAVHEVADLVRRTLQAPATSQDVAGR
jgi:hypothetical protein